MRPDAGFTVPAHSVTTRNLGAAYPLVAEAGLGNRGVLIGQDLLGGSFVYDPFELYGAGIISNPNMIVFGQIGRGKSSLLKTYLWRQCAFGRRAWVVDPKGEYSTLAERWGVRPVALAPGGSIRLNPLDPVRTAGAESVLDEDRRQSELLASLAAACLSRPLVPRERAAVDLALDAARLRAGVPTLPRVVEALLDPTLESALAVRTGRESLLEDGRDVALELRRLVDGDMRGMFDGETSAGLDLSGALVVLDLSALYASPALGVLMACATAWLQAALFSEGGGRGRAFLVVDEAWAILANLGVARWLQASWKLSRAHGAANVAALHRLSDLSSVGAAGSEQVGLAEGLLSDSETLVIYAQPAGEVARAQEMLALSSTEAELVPQLQRGVALWKVGQRSFLVRHVVGTEERAIVDTDAAMVVR
ncbi:MAG: ATP-binding protein [Acidimicrobiales bacterium]